MMDRLDILDKVRAALTLHQWIVAPDFDQEGEVQRAEATLAMQPASLPPLIAAAQGFRDWIETGETRPAMRSALIRFWRKRGLLRLPVPLTGAAALRPVQSWEPHRWLPAFLGAIEGEATNGLDVLYSMERAWFTARRAIAGRRILDSLVAAEIAIEVTHRSKRRLFGLQGLTPLRHVARPPYRPDPARGPGRPRHDIDEDEDEPKILPPPLPPLPPLTPIERRAFDYTALEEAMAHLDAAVRTSRFALRSIVESTHCVGANPAPNRAEAAPDC